MRKLYYILIFISLALILSVLSTKVSATSWVKMEPKEVFNRAEVIVIGQYDFNSEAVPGKFIFKGLDFHVRSTYKGNVSDSLIVGIDHFDVGWVEDFQKDGGEFLMFLEKDEQDDFLIPVGGPNGMVQIVNGKVHAQDQKTVAFYEKFLSNQKIQTQLKDSSIDKQEKYTFHYLSFVILIGVGSMLLVSRKWKKR
ncbi:hypothetical protein ACFYKX_05640 [Cytobacillus sp. FJAT-54145]|uniref:Uncharacterized protein n=1 Tax=Cytobacillus spartinae TaxID=3299023 RepID=A0ABW6K7D7_9BACI